VYSFSQGGNEYVCFRSSCQEIPVKCGLGIELNGTPHPKTGVEIAEQPKRQMPKTLEIQQLFKGD
jgi:hypothetical protein